MFAAAFLRLAANLGLCFLSSGIWHACAGHNYIGTEHILMGLLREGEGVAARVLETLGADQTKIRTQVRGWRVPAYSAWSVLESCTAA